MSSETLTAREAAARRRAMIDNMGDKARTWVKGQSGNPGGKPKGSRNALQGDFVRALASDFERKGRSAIIQCRRETPAKYLAIIASLMPKEVEITRPLDELSDEQLDAAAEAVRALLVARGSAADHRAGAIEAQGQEPARGVPALPKAG